MAEKNLRVALAVLGAMASGGVVAGVAAADGGPKATINHKGKPITVSCNALDGHRAHADVDEEISIKAAQERCVKIIHHDDHTG